MKKKEETTANLTSPKTNLVKAFRSPKVKLLFLSKVSNILLVKKTLKRRVCAWKCPASRPFKLFTFIILIIILILCHNKKKPFFSSAFSILIRRLYNYLTVFLHIISCYFCFKSITSILSVQETLYSLLNQILNFLLCIAYKQNITIQYKISLSTSKHLKLTTKTIIPIHEHPFIFVFL